MKFSRRHIWVLAGILVTIAILLYIFVFHHAKVHAPTESSTVGSTTQKDAQVAQTLSSSSLYVGEVFWGRGIEYFARRSPLGYAFPFSGLSEASKQKYDNWVGDLECPVTTTDVPYQTQVDYLQLNCRPEYLPEAAKWFDVFTLANNHMYDSRGDIGLAETRGHLEDSHIQYFGGYDPSFTDDICEVVSMHAKLTRNFETTDVHIPVAMCGYMYVVDTPPATEQLAVMAAYAKLMPVIAMPHMGVEYLPIAEQQKVDAYHAMIDAGADVVLASHPHVIQNSESYKGRLIQYSPGNFMFDQQSLERANILTLGVGLTLSTNDVSAIEAYTSLGDKCRTFKDSCLRDLSARLSKRPAFSVNYQAECFTEPNYYPKTADESTCNDIKTQSTWDAATTGLNTTW